MTDVTLDVTSALVEIDVDSTSVELTVAPVDVAFEVNQPNVLEVDVGTTVVDINVAPVTVDLTFNPPPTVNFLVTGGGGGGSGVPGEVECYVPVGGTPNQVLSKRTGADFDTVWSAPGVNTYRTPEDHPLPVNPRFGDLWFDGENNNVEYRWDGTAWVDVHDLGIDLAVAIAESNADDISNNADAISDINNQLTEIVVHTESAERAADTADGRISMSDYEPTPDDVTYSAIRHNFETDLDEVVQIPRIEGSLWYQRTRPRQNLVTNPSFEKNANGWQATGGTIVRWAPVEVPDVAGSYGLKVTGASLVEPTYSFPADEGEWYSGSGFMQTVTGSGAGVFATLTFYDVTNAILSTTTGEVEDLAPPPPTPDGWDRINVVDQAPAGAKSYRVGFHNPNPGDVWYFSAAIVENLDELGKYFDGDSYDGFWEGGTGNPQFDSSQNPGPGDVGWQESTSRLYGDKILGIWELHEATWVRKYLTDNTLSQIDARKITNLDQFFLAPNSVAINKMDVPLVVASEALAKGDVVNVYSNASGQARVRRANAAAGSNFQATGFVLDDIASGASARVYSYGTDFRQIGMAPGPKWLAEVPGSVVNTPPATVGCTVQQVGTAVDIFYLLFAPLTPVRIT